MQWVKWKSARKKWADICVQLCIPWEEKSCYKALEKEPYILYKQIFLKICTHLFSFLELVGTSTIMIFLDISV